MKVYNLSGKETGTITPPRQFKEELRTDLIKRAYNSIRSHNIQPKGAKPRAGLRHNVEVSKTRKKFKSGYGHGKSRSPKKTMTRAGKRFGFVAAQAPFAVGGRRAHPPVTEKVIAEKINKKENRKAIRSAISASKPVILESKLEKLDKTKELIKVLESNGIKFEAEKKLKKGIARLRGRGKSYTKGPLLIVSKNCELIRSGPNMPGVDVTIVDKLNVALLAPGSKPGRVTVWSEDAIKKMQEAKLFL